MKIRIRSAKMADIPSVTEIYNEVIRTSVVTFDVEEKSADDRLEWFKQFDDAYPLVVAEHNHEILGYACLSRFRPRPAYAKTVEDSIYIKKDARGNGVGAMLLAKLIHEARAQEHHSIVAVIANDEPFSVKLHEKFGFVKTGMIREAGFKFGKWHDISFYQRMLKERNS